MLIINYSLASNLHLLRLAVYSCPHANIGLWLKWLFTLFHSHLFLYTVIEIMRTTGTDQRHLLDSLSMT